MIEFKSASWTKYITWNCGNSLPYNSDNISSII